MTGRRAGGLSSPGVFLFLDRVAEASTGMQFLRIHRSVSLVWALSASNNVSITVYIFKKLNLMTFALKERGLFAVAF